MFELIFPSVLDSPTRMLLMPLVGHICPSSSPQMIALELRSFFSVYRLNLIIMKMTIQISEIVNI